jgi:hypothetical protein
MMFFLARARHESGPGSQDREVSRTEGKTPVFVEGEVQKLLNAVEGSTHTGRRDRALLGTLDYLPTLFARMLAQAFSQA